MFRKVDQIKPGEALIQDPLIEPYYIIRGTDNVYTIYLKSQDMNAKHVKTIGYFTDFGMCLKRIAKEIVTHKKGKLQFDTINEYIAMHKEIKQQIATLVEM